MIVAVSQDCGIGYDNKIPWNVPEDLKFFSSITSFGGPRNTLVMGRNTFESLNHIKLSKSRDIIVLSSTLKQGPNYSVFKTLNQAVESVKTGKVWVIGGKKVYEEALLSNDLHLLVVSRIPGKYKCDVYLESLNTPYFYQNFTEVDNGFTHDYSDQFKVEIYRKKCCDVSGLF